MNPGRARVGDMLTVGVSCRGIIPSMFGRIVHNWGSDAMLRAALAAFSLLVMLHLDDNLSPGMSVVLLPAVIYGTYRHRMVGGPKIGLQSQPVG